MKFTPHMTKETLEVYIRESERKGMNSRVITKLTKNDFSKKCSGTQPTHVGMKRTSPTYFYTYFRWK